MDPQKTRPQAEEDDLLRYALRALGLRPSPCSACGCAAVRPRPVPSCACACHHVTMTDVPSEDDGTGQARGGRRG